MSKRTPPFPEYPEWTSARFQQFIRSALRRAWSRWPPKYKCLNEGRRAVKNKRHKWELQCAKCKHWFQYKEVNVDHIIPAGSDKDWNEFISKLFVGVDKLQRLCKKCHKKKTIKEQEKKNG